MPREVIKPSLDSGMNSGLDLQKLNVRLAVIKPSLDSGLNSGLNLQKLNVRLAKMLKSAVVLFVKPFPSYFSYVSLQQIYPGSFKLKVAFFHACISLYAQPFIDTSMQKPRM